MSVLDQHLLDGLEQVVDGLVAVRRDGHALAIREQRRDHVRAGVRLARAGRPLDEQVAAVEAAHGVDGLCQRCARVADDRLAGCAARESRHLLLEEGFERTVAMIAIGHALADAEQGVLEHLRLDGPSLAHVEALGQRPALAWSPRANASPVLVHLEQLHRDAPSGCSSQTA